MMKLSAVFLTSLFAIQVPAGSAWASSQSGRVTAYTLTKNAGQPHAFILEGSRSKPACATEDAWSLPSDTDNARAILAAIMTAASQNKSISVTGTGTCDPNAPTREQIGYISFGF